MQNEYYTIEVTTEEEVFDTIRHTPEGLKNALMSLRLAGYEPEQIVVFETKTFKTNKGKTYRLLDEMDIGNIVTVYSSL